MLRFDGCEIWGFGPFRKTVKVDFSAISGLLIALVGPNGAGKTTFLECMTGGALYRRTETRGTLLALATERGAYVETWCANGSPYRIKQTVDPITRKGTSLVLDVANDNRSVLDSTSVEVFDEWSREHMPPQRVLYSSLFAAQTGKNGFLGLKESEQKEVLLRVIGVEELEEKAKRARAKLKAKKDELATLMTRIADEKARGLDIAAAEKALAEMQATVVSCTAALEVAREALAAAEKRAADVEREIAEERKRVAALKVAEATLAELTEKHRLLAVRLTNNRDLLGKKEEIARAAVRDPELATAETRARELHTAASRVADAAQGDIARHRQAETTALKLRVRRADTIAQLRAKLKDELKIEAAVQGLPQCRDRLADAELAQSLKWERLQELRDNVLQAAEKRIHVMRPALEEIADQRADDPSGIACDAIAADDDTEKLAEKAAAEIDAAEIEYEKATADVDKRKGEVAELEKLAARAESLAETRAQIAQAEGEHGEATLAAQVAGEGLRVAERALEAARAEVLKHEKELARITKERAELGLLLKRKEPLAVAEARIAELEPQLEEAAARLAEATIARDALKGADVVKLPVDVASEKRKVEKAEADLQHATSMIAVAEARKASAEERARKLASFGEKRAHIESEIADWALLADSLGRDGLQALEIDVAGPELTELINDLLHTCLGTRWSVWVSTTRQSGDGKKQIEDLQLRVLDSQHGREGEVDTLSGGEKVLVGEAISLALTMLSCRRSGVEHPTLIRDESGAALDPENGPVYIAMLRHAARVVEASHVIFVSHSPAVQALADERIIFEKNGDVHVGEAA